MKRLTLLLLSGFLILLWTAPALASSDVRGRIVGPSPFCEGYAPSGSTVGRYTIQAQGSGAPGFRTVAVSVSVRRLLPNQSYEVWLVDDNVQNGIIVGCQGQDLGTLTTTHRGRGSFDGNGIEYTGTHIVQVAVAQDLFGASTGYLSTPKTLQVP
jgi:hypothetical protein